MTTAIIILVAVVVYLVWALRQLMVAMNLVLDAMAALRDRVEWLEADAEASAAEVAP